MQNWQESIEAADWLDSVSCLPDIIQALDQGALRVAEKVDGSWITHAWVKKAILMYMRQTPASVLESRNFDKIPPKQAGWAAEDHVAAGFRSVPGHMVRKGAYVAPRCVLMPSFINIGAYVDEDTMVDTWATVGSCAQIGKRCHISGGAGIGGVLEPLQASPVIIEDDCFIGARSEVAEGVIVEQGAVLSMGVFLGASTRVVDRETGEIITGRVPAYSVVVPGTWPDKNGIQLSCAIIVKKVDAQTRSKTSLNELLRFF